MTQASQSAGWQERYVSHPSEPSEDVLYFEKYIHDDAARALAANLTKDFEWFAIPRWEWQVGFVDTGTGGFDLDKAAGKGSHIGLGYKDYMRHVLTGMPRVHLYPKGAGDTWILSVAGEAVAYGSDADDVIAALTRILKQPSPSEEPDGVTESVVRTLAEMDSSMTAIAAEKI